MSRLQRLVLVLLASAGYFIATRLMGIPTERALVAVGVASIFIYFGAGR